jgi:putative ABC transport system substrate-binding protein
MVSRRALLAAAASTIGLAFPVWAQRAPARIIWLSPTSEADSTIFYQELLTGLREQGLVDKQNVTIQPFWDVSSPQRAASVLADMGASKPNVIVTQGSTSLAVKPVAADIPIVFGYSGDPVQAGLVETIARPGRSATGVSYLTLELVGKRMELLKEVLPKAKHVAVVASPQHPGDQSERNASETAARALGLDVTFYEARTIPQQMEALAKIETSGADAVMLFPVQNIISNRHAIAEWSAKTKIPTISGWAQFAEGGNLMSYGPNLLAANRRLAAFVDNILKGSNPAELPVELPTRVELAINMKTARNLGVTIPPSVLIRADKLIE